jgi:hypothetical protein
MLNRVQTSVGDRQRSQTGETPGDTSKPGAARRRALFYTGGAAALLRAAGLAGAIAIHDPRFGQVVRRHFDLDAIAEKNFDAVAA